MIMDARMKWWMWVTVWSSWMAMVAFSGAITSDGYVQDAMEHWESMLPGTVMPTGFRALFSPMSSSEATQFFTNIVAENRKYLPAHAAAFCKSAHLKCAQSGLHPERLERHIHADKNPQVLSELSAKTRSKVPSLESPHFLDLYSYQGSGIQTIEPHSKARLLTSGHVHEFSNAFFLERQVFVRGSVIHVDSLKDKFGVSSGERAFLPRKLAELFPIVGIDGSTIASKLRVSKTDLQETLEFCEGKRADNEACYTSMEDVADFVWETVARGSGRGIEIYDSVSNASEVTNAGNYFVVEDVKVLKGRLAEPSVSCHDLEFPFRVFYCHSTNLTRMFEVTVRGEDGSLYEQTVVCHYDTSFWNPKHFAMVLLHVKPGESEVCHFMGTSWLKSNGWIFVRGAALAS